MLKKMYEIWKSVLTKPKETFRLQAKKADYVEAVKHVGVAGVIQGILTGIFITLGLSAVGGLFGYGSLGASLGGLSIIGLAISVPIMAAITLFIGSGIFYIIARLLGGKGNYQTQTYLMAIYMAPLGLIGILAMIPFVGILVSLGVTIYMLYLLTLALKETHKFTTGRAVLTWLLPLIVIMVLVMLLAASFALVGLSGLSALGV